MILLTGATGFIGPKIAHALRSRDLPVRALVRDPGKTSKLVSWGVETVRGDMASAGSLRAAVAGCDTVVHLVSIRTGGPRQFERIMAQGTRDLVAAAQDAGVGRWIQMSASGVGEATKDLTPYYAAKFAMEDAVKGSGIPWVIFRPTFAFGREGGVLPTFIRQARWLPATPVVGRGEGRLQPIWVDDVGEFFAEAARRSDVSERVFELGGPDAVSWNELVDRLRRVLGVRRPRVNVPVAVVRTQARLFELMPSPLITRDDIKMITALDHVADVRPAVETFKVSLMPLDEQLRRASQR